MSIIHRIRFNKCFKYDRGSSKNSPSLINSPIPDPYNQINVSNKVTNIILGMRDIVDFSAWEGKPLIIMTNSKNMGTQLKNLDDKRELYLRL